MKRKIALGIIGLLVAIQLVPVKRDNPPETAPLQAEAEVTAIFQRSCFDCHSNQTVWPWYSKVAPLSWMVAHHVQEGRDHLNFSDWEALSDQKKRKLAGEIMDEVGEGEMPLKGYPQMHPEARLTGADLNVIKAWCQQVGG